MPRRRTSGRRNGTTTPSNGGGDVNGTPSPARAFKATKLKHEYKLALPESSTNALIRGWDMHFTATLIVWGIIFGVGAFIYNSWHNMDEATQQRILAPLGISERVASFIVGFVLWMIGFYFAGRRRSRVHVTPRPRTSKQYERVGLGSTSGTTAAELYLDMVKRALVNVIYQDEPQWMYDDRQHPFLSDGFDLEYRVRGEDVPRHAHTMTGLGRLSNVQELITDVVRRGVPGDVIETGVYRGGTTVFMKACLRALGEEHKRKVWVCDTFQPQHDTTSVASRFFFDPLVRQLASVPGTTYRRMFFNFIQSIAVGAGTSSFPKAEDASENSVDVIMFILRHAGQYAVSAGTSLEEVQETFLKYGLLDDNVKFLKGFFSDTLPTADIEQLSVIRLDGDTYESTITAIEPLYPKLSQGGYVIVDDYNSLTDCKRAIDAYRSEHNITAELVPIDNLSVYWKKE